MLSLVFCHEPDSRKRSATIRSSSGRSDAAVKLKLYGTGEAMDKGGLDVGEYDGRVGQGRGEGRKMMVFFAGGWGLRGSGVISMGRWGLAGGHWSGREGRRGGAAAGWERAWRGRDGGFFAGGGNHSARL